MAPASSDFNFFSQAIDRKPLPSDPVVRADIEAVLRDGFVIIPDCFTKDEAAEARNEIMRLLGESPRGGESFCHHGTGVRALLGCHPEQRLWSDNDLL
jgi:hypothetical protein